MKELTNYMQKKKYIILFLVVLFIFGVIVGMIMGLSNLEYLTTEALSFKENIATQGYNYILLHFFFLAISLFFSYFGVGIPLLLTILFYEGMSFGLIFTLFTSTFSLGGFLFACLFLILTKGIYLILLCFFFFHALEIARKRVGDWIYKTNSLATLQNRLKACIFLIGACFILDTILLLFGTPLISFFQFLLK